MKNRIVSGGKGRIGHMAHLADSIRRSCPMWCPREIRTRDTHWIVQHDGCCGGVAGADRSTPRCCKSDPGPYRARAVAHKGPNVVARAWRRVPTSNRSIDASDRVEETQRFLETRGQRHLRTPAENVTRKHRIDGTAQLLTGFGRSVVGR